MRELDLIPEDYRIRRWQFAYAKRIVSGGVIVLLAVVVLAVSTVRKNEVLGDELAALEVSRDAVQKATVEYQALNVRLSDAQATLDRLQQMRTGASAADILNTVNRAIKGREIWFDSWEFRRTGLVEDTGSGAVETGYFVVTPNDGSKVETGPLIETHMTIRGQASDHAALSDFVKTMIAQPTIAEVRVVRTYKQSERKDTPLSFDVAIVLQTPVRS